MAAEISPLQKLRFLVKDAATHGGRVNLLTVTYREDGKPRDPALIQWGDGQPVAATVDPKGPLTELFIEQNLRKVRPDSLVKTAVMRPQHRRREQYFDIQSVTVRGRDVRLGVEVVLDDSGVQQRTFFAEGPTLIQRWARTIKALQGKRRRFLPPDAGDRFS